MQDCFCARKHPIHLCPLGQQVQNPKNKTYLVKLLFKPFPYKLHRMGFESHIRLVADKEDRDTIG